LDQLQGNIIDIVADLLNIKKGTKEFDELSSRL
jgi:hypothetical protein